MQTFVTPVAMFIGPVSMLMDTLDYQTDWAYSFSRSEMYSTAGYLLSIGVISYFYILKNYTMAVLYYDEDLQE